MPENKIFLKRERIKIDRNSLEKFKDAASLLRSGDTDILDVFFDTSNPPNFFKTKPLLYFLINKFENRAGITYHDLPLCILPDAEEHIVNEKTPEKTKPAKCKGCKHDRKCGGVFKEYAEAHGTDELSPQKDIPEELVIELTARCNLNCDFCFNRNVFRSRGVKEMETETVKETIDNANSLGIPFIRFTGGEPLMRDDVFELLSHAKSKGFAEVRLNTNAAMVDIGIANKLSRSADNVLVSVITHDRKREKELTGTDSLDDRIAGLENLKKSGIRMVRAGTVATPESIKNLDKISSLVKEHGIPWMMFRTFGDTKSRKPLSRKNIVELARKLLTLRREGFYAPIANAIPFCAHDLETMNFVSEGAKYDDGHSRVVIDPRGHARPSYHIERKIGNPPDLMACWNHPFMRKMRNLEFLPKPCVGCVYSEKCMGGSRFAAYLSSGSYSAKDPLANGGAHANKKSRVLQKR